MPTNAPPLSIVVPALNAAGHLAAMDRALAGWCARTGSQPERILVDGGSDDDTVAVAHSLGWQVVDSKRGRGRQLAAGAAAATAPWLLFLHADTCLGAEWVSAVRHHQQTDPAGATAGYFAFRLDDPDRQARRLERCVAGRCRRMALPYGDQGLLVHRTLYMAVGGYRHQPLMEDVNLVRRLGGKRLRLLPARAVTAADRYRRDGYRARPRRNVTLLVLYFMGVPTSLLAKLY